MDEETQKIIADQMKQLPKDVVEAIVSVDYKTKLQEITKRQRLLIDQAAKLETETTLVMIGLEPLADYVGNLQRELSIPIMRAKEISQDVSDSIFKPIRDSLKVMNESGENSEIPDNEEKTKAEKEEMIARFTNSNEANLNRDQILNEIENPATISGGTRVIDFVSPMSGPIGQIKSPEINLAKTTDVEIRPGQEIETIPGQNIADIKSNDLLTSKMTGPTITTQQIIEATPEIKLPEVKKRPSSGVDPYREPLK